MQVPPVWCKYKRNQTGSGMPYDLNQQDISRHQERLKVRKSAIQSEGKQGDEDRVYSEGRVVTSGSKPSQEQPKYIEVAVLCEVCGVGQNWG